jgi:hypothetical protein
MHAAIENTAFQPAYRRVRMTSLPVTDGATAVGVLRIFVPYAPKSWEYIDLYLAEDAMRPAAAAADELGWVYDQFDARIIPEGCGYHSVKSGTEYVIQSIKWPNTFAGKGLPDLIERKELPPPEDFT